MADFKQPTQSSFQFIQFLEKCDTILHPPFQRFERFVELRIYQEFERRNCNHFQGQVMTFRSIVD